MEPNYPTLIVQLSRLSLREGLSVAHLASHRTDAGDPTTSDITNGSDGLQMSDPFEVAADGIADRPVSTNELCDNCEKLDIVSHLKRQGLCKPALEQPLGTLLEVVSRTGCSFCAFVKEILRAQYAPLVEESFWQHCSIYRSPVTCILEEMWVPSNATLSENDRIRFGFHIKLYPHPYLSSTHHDGTKLTLTTFHSLADPLERGGMMYKARKIAHQLDAKLLRSWLAICEIRHPYHPYHLPGLRVIDLLENRLVLPDVTVRYMALSYTWGNAQTLTLTSKNSEELHTVGGLGRHTGLLPRTIRDAMRLTKMLQERFLWIDALCITQDDVSEKQTQIMRMDNIYQNAILTVVACTGISANSGLPGVHPHTRLPMQIATSIRGQTLISQEVEQWWKEASGSVWNSRGWTYQEQICSNRLLMIGKSQAHFRCAGNCVFCEDIAAEVDLDTSSLFSPSPQTTNYFPRAIWTSQRNSFQAYQEVVTECSKRAISNTRDVLNAVWGVLNRWRYHFGHWGLINGLPAGMMDAALLWHGKGLHRRRRDPRTGQTIGYPSWSWAAWEGEIENVHVRHPHETLQPMIKWEHHERYEDNLAAWRRYMGSERPDMADGPAQNWTRSVSNTNTDEPLSVNYVDKSLSAVHITYAYPSRMNAEATTVYGTTDLNGGTLRFRTKCAIFSLASRNLRPSSKASSILQDKFSLIVLDKDHCAAGAVQIPPRWEKTMTKTPQEVIVLSRTTLTQDVDDPSWDETTKTFLREKPPDRDQVVNEGKKALRLRSHLTGREEPESYIGSWNLFDRRKYDAFKFWPLYNVMLIARDGEYAFRRGLGQIHVDALDALAEEKLVLLG